ncbi:hypothetical protein F5888DRAFT_1709421 [Russula emetica]|nr:hypothetical protein F5888DRAFT_1709421 [Russula emetica]
MRAFNFSLIAAVLSCIAMIGATPVGNLNSVRRQNAICDTAPQLCQLCANDPLEAACSVLCSATTLQFCSDDSSS